MSLNPLAPVTDYQTMLNRIFWFTTAAALVVVWLLRLHLPRLDVALQQIDFTMALGGDKLVAIPGGYLLPALGVGILMRVFRLHARVSDWLGVRECFDIEVIISELADRVGVDLALVPDEELRRERHAIMRNAFYQYVSGDRPQIDSQLVQQALDAWSWFWVGTEATIVFVVCGLGLVAGGVLESGLEVILGSLLFGAICLPVLREQCRRYAVAQVRAIVADRARAANVREVFAEVTGEQQAVRRAA
jgi:hypothetical protein